MSAAVAGCGVEAIAPTVASSTPSSTSSSPSASSTTSSGSKGKSKYVPYSTYNLKHAYKPGLYELNTDRDGNLVLTCYEVENYKKFYDPKTPYVVIQTRDNKHYRVEKHIVSSFHDIDDALFVESDDRTYKLSGSNCKVPFSMKKLREKHKALQVV